MKRQLLRKLLILGLGPLPGPIVVRIEFALHRRCHRDRYYRRGSPTDIVALDANPLDDIGNTQRIGAVFVNGSYLSRGEFDKMLAEVEKVAQTK